MRKKKNEFVFTIGFKEKDPEHIRVVKMLNEMDSKNQFIVDAILCYVDSGYMNMKPWNILPATKERELLLTSLELSDSQVQSTRKTSELEEDMEGILQSLQAFRCD